jgi:uncharacterized damage-inducible protein DinB
MEIGEGDVSTSEQMGDNSRYWRRVRARTLAVAERIPASRVAWSPGGGAMTLGRMVRHLAMTERWLFVEVLRGGPSRYRGDGDDDASLDESLGMLRGVHEESLAILETLTGDDWARMVITPTGAELPAWKWFRAMVEHEVHHRGQLYLALRLAGVATPPIFGATSEEVAGQAGEGA